MYKVGQTLGYAVESSDEKEKPVRLTITDVVFSQFDEEAIEKYLVDFRDDETERQLDSLYWYPHIYPTWEAFVNAMGYQVILGHTNRFMIATPMGDIVVDKSTDSDYPGVFVDLHDQHGEEIQLLMVEHHPDKGLRVVTWDAEYQDDINHEIIFIPNKKEVLSKELPQVMGL